MFSFSFAKFNLTDIFGRQFLVLSYSTFLRSFSSHLKATEKQTIDCSNNEQFLEHFFKFVTMPDFAYWLNRSFVPFPNALWWDPLDSSDEDENVQNEDENDCEYESECENDNQNDRNENDQAKKTVQYGETNEVINKVISKNCETLLDDMTATNSNELKNDKSSSLKQTENAENVKEKNSDQHVNFVKENTKQDHQTENGVFQKDTTTKKIKDETLTDTEQKEDPTIDDELENLLQFTENSFCKETANLNSVDLSMSNMAQSILDNVEMSTLDNNEDIFIEPNNLNLSKLPVSTTEFINKIENEFDFLDNLDEKLDSLSIAEVKTKLANICALSKEQKKNVKPRKSPFDCILMSEDESFCWTHHLQSHLERFIRGDKTGIDELPDEKCLAKALEEEEPVDEEEPTNEEVSTVQERPKNDPKEELTKSVKYITSYVLNDQHLIECEDFWDYVNREVKDSSMHQTLREIYSRIVPETLTRRNTSLDTSDQQQKVAGKRTSRRSSSDRMTRSRSATPDSHHSLQAQLREELFRDEMRHCDDVRFTFVQNLHNGQQLAMPQLKWLVDLQNVYSQQLPRMGREYVIVIKICSR